jgi:hypothetical protein
MIQNSCFINVNFDRLYDLGLHCLHHIDHSVLLVLFAQGHQILYVRLQDSLYLPLRRPEVVLYRFFVLCQLRVFLFLEIKFLFELGIRLKMFLFLGVDSLFFVFDFIFETADVVLVDFVFVFELFKCVFCEVDFVSEFLYFFVFVKEEGESVGLDFFDFVFVNFFIGFLLHHERSFFVLDFGDFILVLIDFLFQVILFPFVGLNFCLVIFKGLFILVFPVHIQFFQSFPHFSVLAFQSILLAEQFV